MQPPARAVVAGLASPSTKTEARGALRAAVLVVALAGLLPALCGQAQAAGFNWPQPLSGVGNGGPGVRSQPTTPQALSAELAQATGLTPAEVSTASLCGETSATVARCAAQALVLRGSRTWVRPHVGRRASFTQVFPSRRQGIAPSATSASAGSVAPQADTPAWLQQAYDLSYLSQTRGGGDTVAIVDAYDDPNAEADLGVYRSAYGLPPCTTANGCFRKINENGQTSPLPGGDLNWEGEESLDLDAVSALCPNCHIVLVEASSATLSDLNTAEQTAAASGARQISNSWAGSSSAPIGGTFTFPGIAVIAATGDHGYVGGGYDNYPAAYPGVTAAGGTSLAPATGGNSARGFGESGWSLDSSGWGGGSGCDLQEAKPAYQTDSGCTGRSYADVSADADANTGLIIYDSGNGGWLLMGGTSLATPLIAAYEAVTGINGSSPSWAYGYSSLLNDEVAGNNGACPSGYPYICNAGPGYDGVTGVGSISGAVVQGAPGIGGPSVGSGSDNTYTQSVTPTAATLTGGIYPNGLDTTYYWQYGTSTSYGQQTAAVDIGSGQVPVMVTSSLQALSPSTVYHYRLVAQNSGGTSYGYDFSLTTTPAGAAPPTPTSAPVVNGSPLRGSVLTVSSSWNPAGTSYGYQWQRSSDGATWTAISGATNPTYTPTAGDEGASIRVIVTATNAYGSASATSSAVGPIQSNPPANTAPPTLNGTAQRTYALGAAPGAWAGAGNIYSYQWQHSNDGATWTSISGATTNTYVVGRADEGTYLRTLITASNVDGVVSQATDATNVVAPYPPANTAAPTISGSAQRTATLQLTLGTWTGPDNDYSYQWQRNNGDGYTDITGAIGTAYTLTQADEGATVRVVVSATNPDATIAEASQPSTTVQGAPPVNTVAPTVTGTAQRSSTLQATSGTWSGPDNTYAYQWQQSSDGNTWTSISGATSPSYTLGVADEGYEIRAVVTATNPDGSASVPSAPTGVVQAAQPVNTLAPTISGTAQRGFPLISTQGNWNGVGNSYAYQWQRSVDGGSTWTDVPGANGATYTLTTADEGANVRLVVTATNPDGSTSAATAATGTVLSAPPVNSAAPTISGTAVRSSTLTSTQGAWDGIGNSYAFQWQRSSGGVWTNISGATGQTYALGVADEGNEVRLLVTASNPDGSVSAASGASAIVQAAPPASTALPTISGTMVRSDEISTDGGAWSGLGNSYGYQWQRSGNGASWSNISGATDSTYTLQVADEGYHVRVLVTASNPDGSASAASAASAAVQAAPPADMAAPTISGTAQRTSVLTSTPGTWTGLGNTYDYQWQRSTGGSTWTDIEGATGQAYTLGVSDEGSEVRLRITASNPDGTASAASWASVPVQAAPPVNTAAPAISGSAQRTATLSASQGTWSGIGNSYSYQWQRSSGSGFTDIAGANGSSYTLGLADEGSQMRVLVTASNPDGTETAASAATAGVAGGAPVNTAIPTVSGIAQRASVLTADPGTWSGLANSYSYRWQESSDGGSTWTDVNGATSTSYTVGVGDEGAQFRFLVGATNDDGVASAASAPTAVVAATPPANTSPPTISGATVRTAGLSSTQGTWGGVGNVYGYRWQRSADGGSTWTDIAGATGQTYTLGLADEGAEVRLLVSASNPDGNADATSAPTTVVQAAPPANTTSPTVSGNPQRASALSSSMGSWSGLGNSYTEQWQRSADGGSTWRNIAGATSSTYTLGTVDEGAELRLFVTASNPDGISTAASVPTAPVEAAPPANTDAPSIFGLPRRTATLTAGTGTWSGVGNAYAYQWQRSNDSGATWTDISGATNANYTLGQGDEGANVRVLVVASNPDATVTAASPATPAVQAAPPVNASTPSIDGSARLGAVLAANPGGWNPDVAGFTYAWQRGNVTSGYQDIPGASGVDYTLQQADVGETVRVVVTATNIDGSASAVTDPTGTVLQPPANTSAPLAPSGTLMDTYALTADPGTWDSPGATFSYAWVRCPAGATSVTGDCTQVATGPAYTLAAADVGHPMAVNVSASSAGGTSAAVSSGLTAAVAGRPLSNAAPPSISGDPQVPHTLSANPGQWTVPLTGVSYTWERCDADGVSNCTPVGSGSSYQLATADDAHTIVVVATASSPGRTATAQTAALTVEDQPLPEASILPVVWGPTSRTGTLQVEPPVWTNSPTTISYQWQRCDATGHNCQNIAGANGTSYTLVRADEGGDVTVTVSATNDSGTGTVTATPTGPVTALPPVNTHLPVITGAAITQGAQLSVGGASWDATADTTYATTWLRCVASGGSCQPIPGATGSTYTLTPADDGYTLRATVTATNPDGSVPATSTPTSVVISPAPRWDALPVLSLDPGHVGDVLTITPGVWSGPAVSQDALYLERCTNICNADDAANATSYAITNADLGAILRVEETASNNGGATTVWSARYVGPVLSASAAAATLTNGTARLRSTTGATLAVAQLSVPLTAHMTRDSLHTARRLATRRVTVRRWGKVRGRLAAWVCSVQLPTRGGPLCTARTSLAHTATLTVPAAIGGKLRVVVVRQGR